MKLTAKTRYGMRAITELARSFNDGPVPASVISRKEGIAIQYLEQILNKLKRSGIVKSTRGPQGGYVLAKEPSKIKVYDIVKVLEGGTSVVFCMDGGKDMKSCGLYSKCATKMIWRKVNQAIEDALNSFTLEDLTGSVRKG